MVFFMWPLYLIHMRLISTFKYGQFDINTLFRQSKEYKMLQMFKKCYKKFFIDPSMHVQLADKAHDFSEKQDIVDAGKFFPNKLQFSELLM